MCRSIHNHEPIAEEWPRLLGWRVWRPLLIVRDDGSMEPILISRMMLSRWTSVEFTANCRPTIDNDFGVHAYCLYPEAFGLRRYWLGSHVFSAPCMQIPHPQYVVGIVDLSGVCAIHDDGVVRAERARILSLAIPGAREHGDHLICASPRMSDDEGETIIEFSRCPTHPPDTKCDDTMHISVNELEQALLRAYDVPRAELQLGVWHDCVGRHMDRV